MTLLTDFSIVLEFVWIEQQVLRETSLLVSNLALYHAAVFEVAAMYFELILRFILKFSKLEKN